MTKSWGETKINPGELGRGVRRGEGDSNTVLMRQKKARGVEVKPTQGGEGEGCKSERLRKRFDWE